jgi:hypothetical protein
VLDKTAAAIIAFNAATSQNKVVSYIPSKHFMCWFGTMHLHQRKQRIRHAHCQQETV